MASDRAATAKSRVDTDKCRKPHRERQDRPIRKTATRLQATDKAKGGPHCSQSALRVLDHFRKYLMTPGHMLCFSSQDVAGLQEGLDELLRRQMVVAESRRSAYCLTRAGYTAMKRRSGQDPNGTA
jgi:hypothetical protein